MSWALLIIDSCLTLFQPLKIQVLSSNKYLPSAYDVPGQAPVTGDTGLEMTDSHPRVGLQSLDEQQPFLMSWRAVLRAKNSARVATSSSLAGGLCCHRLLIEETNAEGTRSEPQPVGERDLDFPRFEAYSGSEDTARVQCLTY